MANWTPGQMDKELTRVLEKAKGPRLTAQVRLRFVNDYIGGQPAGAKAIGAFVKHHLGLEGDDATNAEARIAGDEVQLSKDGDEVDEKLTYGLNVVRRSAAGYPFIGTWQVRAMLKQSASRLGLFKAKGKMGSKGDLAEMMVVEASGASLEFQEEEKIQQIILLDHTDPSKPYTGREYEKFMGSVNTPSGKKSIVCDAEVIPIGCEICVNITWPTMRIKEGDMAAIWAAAQTIGLGSMKYRESGRFKILSMEIA